MVLSEVPLHQVDDHPNNIWDFLVCGTLSNQVNNMCARFEKHIGVTVFLRVWHVMAALFGFQEFNRVSYILKLFLLHASDSAYM